MYNSLNVDLLFSSNWECYECDDSNKHEIELLIKTVDNFARLTNSTCFIIDYDVHKTIYHTERLLYLDDVNDNGCQRICENPYLSLISDSVLECLIHLRNQYLGVASSSKFINYDTHICITDYPIIIHGKEVYINQKCTPLAIRKDGTIKLGLFTISPSTCNHLECFIITKSGQRWRFDFAKGIFYAYDIPFILATAEKRILQRVLKGMTIEEIAIDLNVSVSSIKTHRTRLFKKLHVKNMPEAVTVAKNYHLV